MRQLAILLLFILPLSLNAQAEKLFNDVSLGESMETAVNRIKDISNEVQLIESDKPNFPLAKDKESHLVCSGVKVNDDIIDKVVFSFADDKLVNIEASGNAADTFLATRKDTAISYIGYEVYFADKLFIHPAKDKVWISNDGGIHAHLFTWENPALETGLISDAEFSTEIPDFIEMGASLDQIKPVLEANSAFTQDQQLDDSDPNAQFQLNCFGVDYMGFPRKIEARFGDDILNVVWILTGKGEEERISAALKAQYGEPNFTNDNWEIYNNWTVGLRKDKPEVLLMKQEIGLQYKESYFKQ